MESNSILRPVIDGLIQTCRDGQEGFRTAAENVEDAPMKQFFNKFSMQRAQFTGELQTYARWDFGFFIGVQVDSRIFSKLFPNSAP